ncbi:AbrB family transcriptional regulator [Acuticoccus sp. MNP-M23]|uniref:AbrB family transcriptional regulator n=1 Tax=Acuticoccus sp. MNP-M23 TaxID=3072793 RepID=UPI0028151EF7|nr:AbrB family transcriptional regulator [Acuticoccus sp. MNP-M23]WMS44456.1 AbrB family transcriptional regulator [Acuticoccus sp. MNP-M23]
MGRQSNEKPPEPGAEPSTLELDAMRDGAPRSNVPVGAKRQILSGLNTWQRRVLTLTLAILGTALLSALNMPLPFLFGPLFACIIAAVAGVPLKGVGQVAVGARTILGVAIGAAITPAVLHELPRMMASVALIPIYISVIGLIGVPYFYKVCKFDFVTSYYAAMPGGLQDMVIFGTEAGGDVRALALIHATRVLIIVTLAPIIMIYGFDVALDNPIGAPASELPLWQMGLMVLLAVVGWKGGERLGLFGASILGPLILTAAFSLMGFIHSRPPAEAILVAQFFIGMGIGVNYVGVTLPEIRRDVVAGFVYVLILAALAAVFTEAVVYFEAGHAVEGFLAFAPGGQAEMTVLAIVAGADLGFVIMHHVIRVLFVITGAPLVARLLKVRPKT